jgi:hypothetical protein
MMQQVKETFRTIANPVIRLIIDDGGEVVGEAWLGCLHGPALAKLRVDSPALQRGVQALSLKTRFGGDATSEARVSRRNAAHRSDRRARCARAIASSPLRPPRMQPGLLRPHSVRHSALARRTPLRATRAATTSPSRWWKTSIALSRSSRTSSNVWPIFVSETTTLRKLPLVCQSSATSMPSGADEGGGLGQPRTPRTTPHRSERRGRHQRLRPAPQ